MATQKEVAAHLDMSDRNLRDLIDRGVIKATDRRNLDFEDCRRQYIRYLRDCAAGRKSDADDGDAPDLVQERARLAREQADHYAMKNAAMRRELLPEAEVALAVESVFGRVKSLLLKLPPKAAPLIHKLQSASAVRNKLTEMIHEALDELAATEVVASATAGDDEEDED